MDSSNAEKIFRVMQKFQRIGLNTKIGEIPRSEIMMLKMIKKISDTNGVTISTLSEFLEISKSAVSQMINALEDKGFVERITTKNDRRLVYVRLTANGEQCMAKQSQTLLKGMTEIFAKMGEEDTEDLLRLLNKLYLIVSENRK